MTAPLHLRAIRPDGTEGARGPLMADVIADVEKAAGASWRELRERGWRLESEERSPR